METQAISAPVERLTREAPKRQVGYGLPCAKCHKYFPADLEVCPICKGRERVSPVVAPRIPKPVQSAAPPSSNPAVEQKVTESTKLESPALVQPIEIKVKDQTVDQKKSITASVVAETPAAVEPARASLVSTLPALTQKEKESPKLRSPAVAAPVEVKVKDQPLDKKEAVKSPAVVELPAAAEPAPANLASTQTALTQKEKQSPKLDSPAIAPPAEIKAKDQPLEQKESTTIPVVAEVPAAVELPHVSLVATQPVSTKKEKESPKSESPTSTPPIEIRAKEKPLEKEESITTPVVAEIPAVVEPAPASLVPTQKKKEKIATKSDSPALAPPVEIKVKDQPLQRKESTAVPVVQLSTAVEPPLASPISTPKAEESPKLESPAITRLNDQPNDDLHQQEPITIAALVEAQASDPVPAVVVPRPEEKERATELKPPAAALPMQLDTEEQRRDKINQALRIVIPMLVETQVSERAPVAAKQEVLEQEKKEQAPKMSEPPRSASEVKVVEAKPIETKIVEVKIVASPAVVDQASHRPNEEKSKAIDKRLDAPPKPADVNAPVVVHVNLGELRAAKSSSERAPTQLKEIEQTEPESSSSDIASGADTSEPSTPVGGRKLDLVTFALGVVVLACAVLLITLAALRLMPRHASEPVRRAKAAYNSAPTADQNTNAPIPTPPPTAAAPGNSASSDSSPVVAPNPVPAQAPAASASNLPSSAGSERVLTLPEGLAEGNLLYRVEPDYPEDARQQGVRGPVVLDLHISKDGLVQGVDLVSGQPLLAQAATAAVKQWRFRTRYVNGNEVEMQARITLHFALPTQ
jgi:TonB family protein